ncbi:hypothetical protein [Acidiphilium sp.]|uniref:hypothetical protein n=1 Tax=Acidiphilium sp. TaxID=527 RepID=UPI003D022961
MIVFNEKIIRTKEFTIMSNNAAKCASWREHVTLTCPGIAEMTTIAHRVGTADADWQRLRENSAQWMDGLLYAIAEFMSAEDLEGFIVRLNEFLYHEAMTAGLALHRSTGALLDQAPESRTAWNAACAAMVAGALRTAFEEVSFISSAYLAPAPIADGNPPRFVDQTGLSRTEAA